MTVVHTAFIIMDIIPMQKAEMNVMGLKLMSKPDLDMYQIKAVLKNYFEKTNKGRSFLKKLGFEHKMDELDMKYFEYMEAFTAYIPVTHKTLNENNYHKGGEIMVAYYPVNVWATFHTKDAPDNNKDLERIEGG